MAFAINRTAGPKKAKKSPLAGWLGRKQNTASEYALPELDVAAGVSRALRVSAAVDIAPDEHETHPAEDPIRDALATIESALYAIDAVREILEQACDVVVSAKDVPEPGGRALLAESYDELRLSINRTVKQSDSRAGALIGKEARHMDVNLGGKTHYAVSAMRLDVGERGLNLSPPRQAFSSDDEISETLAELDNALHRADRAAAGYCRDAQYLIARSKGEYRN